MSENFTTQASEATEHSQENIEQLLHNLNWKRAEILAQHLDFGPQQIFQYLNADRFEDLASTHCDIAHSILATLSHDPESSESDDPTQQEEPLPKTRKKKNEAKKKKPFRIREVYEQLVSPQDENSAREYDTLLTHASPRITLKNTVALLRAKALLQQQFIIKNPETLLKKNVAKSTAMYCAQHLIPIPKEIVKALPQSSLKDITTTFRSEERKRKLEADVHGHHRNLTLTNYVELGLLPQEALFNTRQRRNAITEIMNTAGYQEAEQRRAESVAKDKQIREEMAKRFYNFHAVTQGTECFAERIFRFSEGTIDLNRV